MLTATVLAAPLPPLSVDELRSISDELGRWIGVLAAAGNPERGIVEHDRLDDDGLPLFPELLIVGTKLPVPILRNLVAFPGAEIRAFAPVWAQVVDVLSLRGRDKSNPLGGLGTIAENQARLADSKKRIDTERVRLLVAGIPQPPPRRFPLALAALGIGAAAASAVAAITSVVRKGRV